ncbi:hypothetical protein SAMN04488564_101915 [Lentzea waywayandensis]|uniref:Uncharacterized protein n=1 Tax=Lentzea waywayandensis TaxID=84724 RepID=A0A1I6D2N6_9PSEU|nr:hypothetical protein [Lentzea waywayandensis]SFQ99725.1 hypothetical protein SAMN04488564_101915 [Lentzea waywayandensis]
MSRNRSGCGGCALAFLALFFGLPLAMVLVSPAIAARIIVDDIPEHAVYLREWLWGAAVSLPLGVLLARFALNRNGRLRRSPIPKRWPGFLLRGVVLLAAMNAFVFLGKKPSVPGDHVIDDGMSLFVGAALTGVVVLGAMAWWDRRPRRVTVEEVRAAAAEADRTLKRVRAENARVRRQAEQVQARLVKLQARNPARPDVEFHSLRVFHRESYQCADTAHLAYGSAQTSLRTMAFVVRHARVAPLQLVVSKRARAEMRAAAAHLQRSQSELRTQVDQGLDMVRTLNANTSDLKHEIRDNCGRQGREWFEALEERVEQAREERRVANRFGGGQ